MKGRKHESETLVRTLAPAASPKGHPVRLALVGSGGSGKSMLAAAVAHHVRPRFRGGVHWFRVGAWDFRTLVEMLALRFGTTRERHAAVPALRRLFGQAGPLLLVLDNHEDDAATARLLDTLGGTPASFLVTARRCLLAGVLVYPVTAPLVTAGRPAFPRVADLTRSLRWNPLALDIADSIVGSGAATVVELSAFLAARGIDRVHVIEHEDDLPEVALLVAWAFERLDANSRRMLGVLAHVEGDHVDTDSLARLARVRAGADRALAALREWHLVQEAAAGRWALHAVVRHAVRKRTRGDAAAVFEHYVSLLERHPSRLDVEQTHLFAAMDHAHRTSDLGAMLRVERLLDRLSEVMPSRPSPSA